MTDSPAPTLISPSPTLARSIADVNKERHRRAGEWGDMTYKFALTETQERALRAKCVEWELNFDMEWRAYNDLFDVAQGTTPAQRKAEDVWHPRRTEPKQLYTGFIGWLEGRYYHRKFSEG